MRPPDAERGPRQGPVQIDRSPERRHPHDTSAVNERPADPEFDRYVSHRYEHMQFAGWREGGHGTVIVLDHPGPRSAGGRFVETWTDIELAA